MLTIHEVVRCPWRARTAPGRAQAGAAGGTEAAHAT